MSAEGGRPAREFPPQGKRVESGPVRFGDDWPGVFLRGDQSLFLATILRKVTRQHKLGFLEHAAVEGLAETLESCDARSSVSFPCAEEKLARLRREIRIMQESLERKNRELDALHYVWCDGGCPSGSGRWTEEELTEEIVQAAERNTARLRRHFNNRQARLQRRGDLCP